MTWSTRWYSFGFELLSPEGSESGAKYLLKRGYR